MANPKPDPIPTPNVHVRCLMKMAVAAVEDEPEQTKLAIDLLRAVIQLYDGWDPPPRASMKAAVTPITTRENGFSHHEERSWPHP